MSSWLAKRTGIHLNLRPLARPFGAVAGGLLGGPAGAALGAGLMGGADNLGHGGNIGSALKDAAISGGTTYAGAKLLPMIAGKLGYGGGDGAAAAGGAPGGGAPTAAPAIEQGFDRASDVGGMGGYTSSTAALPAPSGNLASRALSSVGGFIKQNPTASLNAAGTVASSYANTAGQNADRRLYRDQIMRSNALEDDERRRRQSIGTAWLQTMAKNGNPMASDLARQLGYA